MFRYLFDTPTGAFTNPPPLSLTFDASGNPVDVAQLKNSGRTYHVAVIGFGGTLPTGFSGRFQFEGKVMATSEGISFTSDNGVRLYDSGNLQYVVFW